MRIYWNFIILHHRNTKLRKFSRLTTHTTYKNTRTETHLYNSENKSRDQLSRDHRKPLSNHLSKSPNISCLTRSLHLFIRRSMSFQYRLLKSNLFWRILSATWNTLTAQTYVGTKINLTVLVLNWLKHWSQWACGVLPLKVMGQLSGFVK